MEVLFASVPVADLHAATRWYGQLFGRAPDIVPNENEIMWCVAPNSWLYVIEDPERAGQTVVTISVSDLNQFVADLVDRGITAGPIESVGEAARKANLVDADGNVLSWIEVATPQEATASPTVASWITPKARKGGPSVIEGRGVHALEPITAGEVVAVKGGHIVDQATVESLPVSIRNSEFRIADDLFLAALKDDEYEAVMMFVNHSCDPNVGMAGNVVLVARCDIAPEEELTIDYALFDDSDEVMECRCGTPSCRGTVTGKDWTRPELQQRYRGSFSWSAERRIEQSVRNATRS